VLNQRIGGNLTTSRPVIDRLSPALPNFLVISTWVNGMNSASTR
jgi:hypothetical protein